MDENKIKELLDKAGQEYNSGKYAEAIAHWEEILAQDPQNQKAREGIRMAKLLVVNWEGSDAEEAGQGGAPVDSETQEKIEFGVGRVRELMASGRMQEAMEGCQLLAELAPGVPAVLQLREEVTQAFEARPFIDESLAQAKKLAAQGKTKEAAEAARKVLSLDKENKEARAIVHAAQASGAGVASKPPSAFQVGEGGAPVPPSPFAHQDDLAQQFDLEESGPQPALQGAPGPAEEAPPRNEEAPLEMDFEDAVPAPAPAASGEVADLVQRGQALFDAGKYNEAIDAWSHIFAIDQANTQAAELIDRARARLDESARQADEIYYQAVDAFEAGDHAKAKPMFEQVLAMQPDNADATSYLEQIQSKAGGGGPAEVASVPLAEPVPPPAPAAPDPDLLEAASSSVKPIPPAPHREPMPQSVPIPSSAGPIKRPRVQPVRPPSSGKRTGLVAAVGLLVVVLGAAGWYFFTAGTGDDDPEVADASTEPAPAPAPTPPSEEAPKDASSQASSVPGKPAMNVKSTAQAPPKAAGAVDEPLTEAEVRKKVSALIAEGKTLLDRKSYAEAQAKFQEVIALQPANFEAEDLRMKAAQAAAEDQKFTRDLDSAKQAFADGDWGASLYKLYRLREDRKDLDILKLYIKNANYNWGLESMDYFDIDPAIEHFNDALEMAPSDAIVKKALTVAQRYERRRRDAAYDAFVSTLKRKALDEP